MKYNAYNKNYVETSSVIISGGSNEYYDKIGEMRRTRAHGDVKTFEGSPIKLINIRRTNKQTKSIDIVLDMELIPNNGVHKENNKEH